MYSMDILKVGYKNIKNRKFSTIINIILLTLSLMVVLLAEMFSSAFCNLKNQMFYGVEGRTIVFSITEQREEFDTIQQKYESYFEKDGRIEYVGEYFFTELKKINIEEIDENIEIDGRKQFSVNMKGYNKAYDKYLIGENEGALSENHIYIPEKINYKENYLSTIDEKMDYLDGNDYIGKKVKIKFSIDNYETLEPIDTYEKEFVIAGTYDNFANGSLLFDIIVAPSVMEESVYNCILEEGSDELNQEQYTDYINTRSIQIVVKDYDDLGEVQDVLKEEFDVDASPVVSGSETTDMIDDMINAVKYAGFILVLVSVINITFTMVKSIGKRKREFALLSAIGYRDSHIYGILLAELASITLISVIIAVAVYIIGSTVVRIYINTNMDIYYRYISISIPVYVWITRICILILGILAAFGFGVDRIKKIVPAKELKEE